MKRLSPLLCFIVLLFVCLEAQTVPALSIYKRSKQLSIKEGLVHNGVTALLKDKRGYLWVGTYDGLNRYNGESLTSYKNTVETKILDSKRIQTGVNL